MAQPPQATSNPTITQPPSFYANIPMAQPFRVDSNPTVAQPVPMDHQFANTNIVTIYVGAERIAFHIHGDLLCKHSAFFRAAFNSGFSEATERIMTLPDDTPQDFERFVHWLYNHASLSPAVCRYRDMVALYILADKYNVPALQRSIFDTFVQSAQRPHRQSRMMPSLESVRIAYENLPQNNHMRRFLANWYMHGMRCGLFADRGWRDELAMIPEFAVDVMALLVEGLCGNCRSKIWTSDEVALTRSCRRQE